MEETIIIKSERATKLQYIINGVIIAIYLVLSLVLYSSNDGYTTYFTWLGYLFFPTLAILIVFNLTLKCALVVTNKRVYGTAVFGKRVDIPLDSISAVGTNLFKGIGVSSSSGAVKFVFIQNNIEIHQAISSLLLKRQDKHTLSQNAAESSADELKKYKDLLDAGVITQEEFEAKKKQLLGL